MLVLEDDCCLAEDASLVLARAGARVLGPCAGFAEAMALADRERPDCAVLDVDLGRGPGFATARALAALGVHIVFVTGSDPLAIPHELAEALCLEKPADFRRIIAAVSLTCGRADPA